jgi:predicted pyridoxine 5'-phosphate oxidase superfamily flavin-nucleotide-binding protein
MHDHLYHEGELAVQKEAGEHEAARRHGIGISSRIVPGARTFLERQRLLALSTTGDDGQLWTSVWWGEAGFVRSADGRLVSIQRKLMTASAEDPVQRRLGIGRSVGMLAIELASRRRLRINGIIEHVADDEIAVLVRESVPNCPKYIQRREVQVQEAAAAAIPATTAARGRELDSTRRTIVQLADTAFVGSVHPERGADTSHRGGAPGFIKVVDSRTLRIPDYAGNSMFMTLGNFAVDSRASLAVIDFDLGLVVSLSGHARLEFHVLEDHGHPTGGTGRYWDFAVREWVQLELTTSVLWQLIDASPFNPVAVK